MRRIVYSRDQKVQMDENTRKAETTEIGEGIFNLYFQFSFLPSVIIK